MDRRPNRPRGFYRIDDRTGFRVRAADTVKEWDRTSNPPASSFSSLAVRRRPLFYTAGYVISSRSPLRGRSTANFGSLSLVA